MEHALLFPLRGTQQYRRGGIRRAAVCRRRATRPPTSNTLEVLDTDDVTWSSDTAAVATVDPNAGLATGVSAGTANITASQHGVFAGQRQHSPDGQQAESDHQLWPAGEPDVR